MNNLTVQRNHEKPDITTTSMPTISGFKLPTMTINSLNVSLTLFCLLFFLTGVYEVSCRVTDHYSAGMRQQYKVKQCPGKQMKHKDTEPTKIVRYFISAEELEWDYSPERDWELEKHHGTLENRCVSTIIAG